MQVLPIALLAFQAAGQAVSSRVLKIDEMPTVVVTTVLCDLLIDPRLFKGGKGWHCNAVRNRRVGTFIALFVGAMTSGGLTKGAGLPSSLWLATALKGSIAIAWMFWKSEEKSEERDLELGHGA